MCDMADRIMSQILAAHKNNKECCLSFADGGNEHLWVRKSNEGYFIDSENLFDSSEFPSETEPLLKEAGIEIVYEPADIYYGYHAVANEEQFKRLLSSHTAKICSVRSFDKRK